VREEMLDRLWPTTVTGNWNNKQLKAGRFMQVGTNNRAIFEGMVTGLRFHNAIGSGRIYGRIHQLARGVYERASKLPMVEMLTPSNDSMYGSLVTFQLKAKDTAPFFAACKRKRIWVMQSDRFRVSTHIHTRPSDIDALFATLDETLGRG
jgi:selenocysteine lyase/cysteine desulfurase